MSVAEGKILYAEAYKLTNPSRKHLVNLADAKVADPWLVSVEMETGHTVVSLEVYNRNLNSKNPSSNPKLPNICDYFVVKYITLYDIMKELKFSL